MSRAAVSLLTRTTSRSWSVTKQAPRVVHPKGGEISGAGPMSAFCGDRADGVVQPALGELGLEDGEEVEARRCRGGHRGLRDPAGDLLEPDQVGPLGVDRVGDGLGALGEVGGDRGAVDRRDRGHELLRRGGGDGRRQAGPEVEVLRHHRQLPLVLHRRLLGGGGPGDRDGDEHDGEQRGEECASAVHGVPPPDRVAGLDDPEFAQYATGSPSRPERADSPRRGSTWCSSPLWRAPPGGSMVGGRPARGALSCSSR